MSTTTQHSALREAGVRTATLDDTTEAYVLARVGFGHVFEILEWFGATPEDAKTALARRDEVREEDRRGSQTRTTMVLAVVHDCDANAVPYVSDGPLGHGWECGKCGQFLQAG